jgi:Tfp pilus assembly protein PilP
MRRATITALAGARASLATLLALGLAACGGSDTQPPPTENPFKPSIERTGAAVAAAPKPAPPPAPASDPSELRKRAFTDADFAKADDNRDPFEYNLKIFVTNVVVPKHCIAQRLSLDELKLIGIIAGVSNPTALFRDPGGGAIRVRTNDLVGRQCARVKRIIHEILPPGPEDTKAHDVSKVIFEITEESGSAQPRMIEKTVWLSPEESGK